MKFFVSGYRNFENPSRYVWVDRQNSQDLQGQNNPEDQGSVLDIEKRESLSPEKKLQKAVELVKHPIRFSYRDIRFCESVFDDPLVKALPEYQRESRNFRAYFRRSAEYFLTLSVNESHKIPPRILYEIGGSRLAKKWLPSNLLKGIDTVIDLETQNLNELVQSDPGSWTAGETAKAISLYKHYRHRQRLVPKLEPAFKKLAENLVEKAHFIAGKKEKLTTSERLMLWEIRRQIPQEFRVHDAVDRALGEKDRDQTHQLLQDITDGSMNNNSDLVLLWDTLEDLAYADQLSMNDEQREKIRRFVLQSNATQLVHALKRTEPKVLLSTHMEALREIRQRPEYLNADFEVDIKIQMSEEEQQKKIRYQKQRDELRKQIREIERTETRVLLEPENAKVTQDQKRKFETAQEKARTFLFEETDSQGKTLDQMVQEIFRTIGETNPFSKQISHLKTQYESAGEDSFKYDKKLKVAQQVLEMIHGWSEKGFGNVLETHEREEREKKYQQENNAQLKKSNQILRDIRDNTQNAIAPDETPPESVSSQNSTLDQARLQTLVDALNQKKQGLAYEIQDLDEAEKTLKADVTQSKSSQLKSLEDKLGKIETKISEKAIEESETEDIFDLFTSLEHEVVDLQEQHQASLEQRLKNHTLHAADFEVLFSTEAGPDTPEKSQILAFRDQFQSLLESIQVDVSDIDPHEIDTENPPMDQLRTFLDDLDRQIGERYFKDQLSSQLEAFPNPQIKTEILHGAMHYFGRNIEEKIQDALSQAFPDTSEAFAAQKDFFLNQVRSHVTLGNSKNIAVVEGAYRQFFNRKNASQTKVDAQRNHLEGAIEGLSEADKSKIRSAYDLGVNMLEYGAMENGRISFPGTQKLREVSLQMADFNQQFRLLSAPLSAKLVELQQKLKIDKTTDFELSAAYESFFEDFDTINPQIASEIDYFIGRLETDLFSERDEAGNLVYKDFILHYKNHLQQGYNAWVQKISKLREAYQSGNSIMQNDWFLREIKNNFSQLLGEISFDNGTIGIVQDRLKKRLFNHKTKDHNQKEKEIDGFADTVKTLNEYGVFESREAADKKMQDERERFNHQHTAAEKALKTIRARVASDLTRLGENDFESKYGMNKEQAQQVVEQNIQNLQNFCDRSKPFLKPDYFQDWWERYQQDDASRFDAISEFQDFQYLNVELTEIADRTGDFEKWLKDWDEYGHKEKQNRWYNRLGVTWVSLYSIYHMIKQNIEIVDTRNKRKQDRIAYNLGQKVFGNTVWGKEFRRMSEESEEQRVKEWETNYNELAPWAVAKNLYKTKDMDEAKACINLLLPQGFIHWNDPELWRTLMRLQSTYTFSIPEDLALEPELIKDKMRDACSLIWSEKTFDDWNAQVDEGWDKEKSRWNKDYTDLASRSIEGGDARNHVLAEMLRKWKNGETEDVYPGKFYSFLFLAFDQGELNGFPGDPRFYYLIKGVTTKNPQGQALLPPSIFNRFNDQLKSKVPHFDFFVDKTSWKKDGRVVPKDTPGAHEGPWTYEDMMAWGDMLGDAGGTFNAKKHDGTARTDEFFHQVINQSSDAIARVHRYFHQASQNLDRDDFAMAGMTWNLAEVDQALSGRSEGTEQKDRDAWRTFLDEFDRFMVHQNSLLAKGDAEYGMSNPNWVSMRNKILTDVAERLRAHFAVTQILSGNMRTKAQEATIFDETEWDASETKGGYSPSAAKSKQNVDRFMREFLSLSGKTEYLDVLDYKGYKMGLNLKDIEAKAKSTGRFEEYQKIREKAKNIVSDEFGDSTFKNMNLVERSLKNYCNGREGNNVVSVDFAAGRRSTDFGDGYRLAA
jgi:hypothetical protein